MKRSCCKPMFAILSLFLIAITCHASDYVIKNEQYSCRKVCATAGVLIAQARQTIAQKPLSKKRIMNLPSIADMNAELDKRMPAGTAESSFRKKGYKRTVKGTITGWIKLHSEIGLTAEQQMMLQDRIIRDQLNQTRDQLNRTPPF